MPILISGLFTIAISVIVFYLENKTKIGKIKSFYKQTIYGLLFAVAAIFATELGSVNVTGALINARDAAIVIGGLLFGPWTAIVSSILAAIDRYFITTIVLGNGLYTQIACTIAILFAGVFTALFKTIIFNKHRPYVVHAAVFVVIVEVIHMIFIPITNLGDLETATMLVVRIMSYVFISNIAVASFAVAINTFLRLKHEGHNIKDVIKNKDIWFAQDLFYSFQFWLLLVIIVAFAANIFIISRLYTAMSLEDSENKYKGELTIMKTLIYEDHAHFKDVSPEYIATIYADQWSDEKVVCFEVADKDNNIVNQIVGFPELAEKTLNVPELKLNTTRINNENVYYMYIKINDARLIAYSYEKYEMYLPYFTSTLTVFIQIIVFGLLMFAVFILLKLLVGNNLNKINNSLYKITNGNLNESVDVYSHTEFAELSDSINATVDTLKNYIDEEANRYKEEFEMAKQIQMSALPNVFPPFPNDPEIDFYAKYKPAKIVGGDFYDYYYVGKNRLAFLIADVSGKGIPAAMFMMRAKTAFRVFAEKKDNPADVLESVNNYLCENNEAEMFVTACFGIVDVTCGKVICASAGHNLPYLIELSDGNVETLKCKQSLVLGVVRDITYSNYIFDMKQNEKLLLYTDGIVEAHDKKNNLYGDDNLKKLLTENRDLDIRDLCDKLSAEVDNFSLGQEQFDDYSILCFIYKGTQKDNFKVKDYWETEITVSASLESVDKIVERCEQTISASNAPKNLFSSFDVCIDEIFSNIIKFSYNNENEYVSARIIVDEREKKKKASITFVDAGPKFNPLEIPDPDITLSAEERSIGGLGIFMVKNMMDDMKYEYKNQANWLTITKYYE